jgi:hypothetical protein
MNQLDPAAVNARAPMPAGAIDDPSRHSGDNVGPTDLAEILWQSARGLPAQHGAMVFAALAIGLWLTVASMSNSALLGDNVEQTIWAHSFEWGYYKHPPLPTWLLIGAARLLGPMWWLTNVLASLCLLGTAFATYALALRLVAPPVAQLTMLLWGLHLTLTWRVNLYNHNTVLMLLCALLALAVVTATQQRSVRHWQLAGVWAGLALLAKYQAVVLLAVLLLALVRGRHLADPLHRRGALMAAVLAALVFSPHLVWLVLHDFLPLHYASTQLPQHWSWTGQFALLSFSLQQVRFFWPSLAAILLCMVFLPRKTQTSNPAQVDTSERDRRGWVCFLTLGPLAIVLLIGLAGTRLQNHWGMQTLQFACLGMASWLARRRAVRPMQLLALACGLHLILLATVMQNLMQVRESGWQGHADKFYPAGQLAQEALADWRLTTGCPLKYVVGPPFEAGSIAVFAGQNSLVFESGNPVASPWIDQADLQRRGALYVAYSSGVMPRTATVQGSLTVTTQDVSKRPQVIHWGAVPPTGPC